MFVKLLFHIFASAICLSFNLYAQHNNDLDIPKPIASYSTYVWAGDLIFLSGQIGLDPENNKLVGGGIEQETKQALDNIEAVLKKNKLGFANIIKVTVMLADIKDFDTFNKIYSERFTEPYPTRTTFAVAALPMNAKIEIDVIAQIEGFLED